MRVLRDIALSIVSAMPGIMIVLIIFVITAFILKLLKVLLNQVEAGANNHTTTEISLRVAPTVSG